MLDTFPFELYFKSYPCFTFRSLKILEIADRSLFSFPCLPLCSLAAGAVRRPPVALGRPWPNPTSSPLHVAPPRAPGPTSLRAGASAASPRHPAEPRTVPAAATATPPWRACCRGRRPLFARARALQKPQQANPFALSLAPRFQTPEHAAAPP